MKVWVDEELCVGDETCLEICPEIFEMRGDVAVAKTEEVPPDLEDVLTIKGEKKQEREEEDENFYCCESSYGSFTRSTRLPHEVESDKIKADYKNGTLKITLPKSEKPKKKEIKIEVK